MAKQAIESREHGVVQAWRRTGASPFVVVDLFSGAGGLSEGFRQAGFAVAAGSDNDPDALATYRASCQREQQVGLVLAQSDQLHRQRPPYWARSLAFGHFSAIGLTEGKMDGPSIEIEINRRKSLFSSMTVAPQPTSMRPLLSTR